MKKLTRAIVLLLALALLLTAAVGCRSDAGEKAEDVFETSRKSKKESREDRAGEDTKPAAEEDTKPAAGEEAKPAAGEEAKPAIQAAAEAIGQALAPRGVTVEEAVLVDQDGVRITVKGLDTDGLFGPELRLLLENDTEQDLTVSAYDTTVNGYMISPLLYADVPAGKKSNEVMEFYSFDLEKAGITAIADIECVFHVFNAETWDDVFVSDRVRIETSAAPGFQYAFDDSGEEVYHDHGVQIVVKGLEKEDGVVGKSVSIYVFNDSDRDITVQVRKSSVNGFAIEGICSQDVLSGKRALTTITFTYDDLEKNGITEIREVELSFHLFYADNWDTLDDSPMVTMRFD